jgi:hypothetical protein
MDDATPPPNVTVPNTVCEMLAHVASLVGLHTDAWYWVVVVHTVPAVRSAVVCAAAVVSRTSTEQVACKIPMECEV